MNSICPTPMPRPGNGEGSATPAHVPNPEVQNNSSTKKISLLVFRTLQQPATKWEYPEAPPELSGRVIFKKRNRGRGKGHNVKSRGEKPINLYLC